MYGRNINMNIIFIIILLLFALGNMNFDIERIIYVLPGLILALTFHEYAHAKVADRLGDPTPEAQGRLTLNPLKHLDPFGTLFIVFAGFGWGKPVQIDDRYFRNPARDTMLVALAGPVSNFIQSIIWYFVYGIMLTFAQFHNVGSLYETLLIMVLSAASINLSLGVFNLIPIPPLDGSKILRYFVHGKARDVLYFLERYSSIILLVLFMTNITSYIVSPVINWLQTGILWCVDKVIGIFV